MVIRTTLLYNAPTYAMYWLVTATKLPKYRSDKLMITKISGQNKTHIYKNMYLSLEIPNSKTLVKKQQTYQSGILTVPKLLFLWATFTTCKG